MICTAHRVLFHLGVLDAPPADPRQPTRPGRSLQRRPGTAADLLLAYCTQAAATRAPATVKAIAGHLAGFGRFLAGCDPALTDLAALDRRATSSRGWPRWPPPATTTAPRCRSATAAGRS